MGQDAGWLVKSQSSGAGKGIKDREVLFFREIPQILHLPVSYSYQGFFGGVEIG